MRTFSYSRVTKTHRHGLYRTVRMRTAKLPVEWQLRVSCLKWNVSDVPSNSDDFNITPGGRGLGNSCSLFNLGGEEWGIWTDLFFGLQEYTSDFFLIYGNWGVFRGQEFAAVSEWFTLRGHSKDFWKVKINISPLASYWLTLKICPSRETFEHVKVAHLKGFIAPGSKNLNRPTLKVQKLGRLKFRALQIVRAPKWGDWVYSGIWSSLAWRFLRKPIWDYGIFREKLNPVISRL